MNVYYLPLLEYRRTTLYGQVMRTYGTFILSGIVISIFWAMFASAEAASPGSRKTGVEKRIEGYSIPNLGQAKFQGWVRRDLTDRIPKEESLFKQYIDEWGFKFETITINGVLFVYNLDLDNRFPYDVTLIDTDCDGIFETKVGEEAEGKVDMPIPECVFKVPVK